METTIVYRGDIGIMKHRMETAFRAYAEILPQRNHEMV